MMSTKKLLDALFITQFTCISVPFHTYHLNLIGIFTVNLTCFHVKSAYKRRVGIF